LQSLAAAVLDTLDSLSLRVLQMRLKCD